LGRWGIALGWGWPEMARRLLVIGGGLARVRDLRGLLPEHPDPRIRFSARLAGWIEYLVIHHSAGPLMQTAAEIAAYHVGHNGWAGIGYHFVVRPSGGIDYVGDVDTSRANVLGENHRVVGICLVGDFETMVEEGGGVLSVRQLRATGRLCAALSSMWGRWVEMVPHRQLGATACPGGRVVAVWDELEGRARRLFDSRVGA